MYLIINRANLVVCITTAVKYVQRLPTGATIIAEEADAAAIYAADADAFYPLALSGEWTGDAYRAVEVESIPDEVVPGYWYYSGEFFTTPEKTAELEAARALKDAPIAAAVAFVVLAEAGQIDDVTATENASQFSPWAYPVKYESGNIRRHEGELYRCIQPHTSQEDWTPPAAVSLWVKVGDPSEEWPAWAQPIGAHDAYAAGAKAKHNEKKWISDVDGNVWEPGVYGWTEQKEEK